MIDIISLCLGGFIGCWIYIALSLGKYRVELSGWNEVRNLACDDTCMCGSPIDTHGWGDNHCAVSQLDWYDSNSPKPVFK